MMNDQWFLIRTRANQATAVIAGPVSGAESYAAYATARMSDEKAR